MPRPARYAPGGMVFHVLNRGVGRRDLFEKEGDFLAFEAILAKTLVLCPMRICCYCLMSNHWHLILWPEGDGQLSAFMQNLTNTHVKRWKQHRQEVGWGHLYQGRFKSFPVECDDYFYHVARYVERNALRASLVERAEDWRWSSLWRRGRPEERKTPLLSPWPLPLPRVWRRHVNEPQTEGEVAAIRRSIQRGSPYGGADWTATTAAKLQLESTLRNRGRPKHARDKNDETA